VPDVGVDEADADAVVIAVKSHTIRAELAISANDLV
jgi:hypothetical protein